MKHHEKGLVLLLAYMYIIILVGLVFGEAGIFWLPLITLMLIAAYESIKWRNKR